MKKLIITILGAIVLGAGGYAGYEHFTAKDDFDTDIQVAPKQAKLGSNSEAANDAEPQAEQEDISSSSSQNENKDDILDNTYPYVLVFANGTYRLSETKPKSKFWQQGTSSVATNKHYGRTTYNQIQPQMGGAFSDSKEQAKYDSEVKQIEADLEADTQEMMQQSVPYED